MTDLDSLTPRPDDPAEIRDEARHALQDALHEVKRVIVGQDEIVDGVLIGLFAGGHVLLEGVPGPGQDAAGPDAGRRRWRWSFNRIQFTPDLMPADIIGTNVVMERPDGRRASSSEPGPIFANRPAADEINRARPRRSRPCSRRCRSTRSPSAARRTTLPKSRSS